MRLGLPKRGNTLGRGGIGCRQQFEQAHIPDAGRKCRF
jgi:hypothetical protein